MKCKATVGHRELLRQEPSASQASTRGALPAQTHCCNLAATKDRTLCVASTLSREMPKSQLESEFLCYGNQANS